MNLDNIPNALRRRSSWVLWKYKTGTDGKKTKVPVNALTNDYASSTDPSTWTTIDQAVSRKNGHDGIGFVFSGDDPFTGIDFDGCRKPETGEIAPWAEKWIYGLDSYSEISPSGTGIKVWVIAKWPLPNGKKKIIAEPDFVPGKKAAVEVYDHARYFCVTGKRLHELPAEPQERQAVVDELCRFYFADNGAVGNAKVGSPAISPSVIERARRYIATIPGAVSGSGGHDQTFHVACVLVLGFNLDKQTALGPFREYNQRCEPPWSDKELTHKLDSADEQPGERGYLVQQGRSDRNPNTTQAPDMDSDVDVGITLADFYAYMPMHSYIFVPGRELWPAASVNAKVKIEGDDIKASAWLDQNQTVEQMTWAPGEGMLIRDRLISDGGWIERKGVTCFNLYRPPRVTAGDPAKAAPWLDHVAQVYGDDAQHVIKWLAHRVQRPQEKVNHALVLGGLQGIGKDTLLEPVKYAIGPWNFCEVSPSHLLGRFNAWIKSVILRINEARDLGDVDRYAFYDHLKAYTAAPPDVLRCDEKNIREYSVLNVCGVVITTNHKTDGIYLPADDRRHYVAWSDLTKDDFPANYWTNLYKWYAREGNGHVAAFLKSLDISAFDPKAPPPKTEAFWAIVDANRAPEDAELSDAIDALGNPDAVTLSDIIACAGTDFAAWLKDRRNSRQIPHRMEAVDYLPVRNTAAKDGQWKIAGKRQAVYARRDMNVRDRIAAAMRLTGR